MIEKTPEELRTGYEYKDENNENMFIVGLDEPEPHRIKPGNSYIVGIGKELTEQQKFELKTKLEILETQPIIVTDNNSVKSEGGIFEALSNVTRDIGLEGISKDRKNDYQRYKYRGIEDALAAFNGVFAKNGVFMMTDVLEYNVTTEAGVNEKGKPAINYCLQMLLKYTFYHKDGSCITGTQFGMNAGKDTSKLTGQITSYCLKEYLFKNFMVPTEGMDVDDPDSRDSNTVPVVKTNTVSKPSTSTYTSNRQKAPYDTWKNKDDAINWAIAKGISRQQAQEIFNKTKPDANNSRKIPFYHRINSETAQKSLPM